MLGVYPSQEKVIRRKQRMLSYSKSAAREQDEDFNQPEATPFSANQRVESRPNHDETRVEEPDLTQFEIELEGYQRRSIQVRNSLAGGIFEKRL